METRDLICPVDSGFFFFFFLSVEALRMSLCLRFRILLLWLPESSMSYAFCSMPSMICNDAGGDIFFSTSINGFGFHLSI